MSKRKLYAVATVGKADALPGDVKDTVTASRAGVDFACMDVALERETFRFHVWPDKTWELNWAPHRWKDADELDKWVFVCAGEGARCDKAKLGRKVKVIGDE